MVLVIHTLDVKLIQVGLVLGEKSVFLSRPVVGRVTEEVTPLIDKLLKRAKLKLSALQGVLVASGPGGFTAVRSGVVVANALGLALSIPVGGVEGEFATLQDMLVSNRFSSALKHLSAKKTSFARPAYGAQPHITPAKKKAVQQHRLKRI